MAFSAEDLLSFRRLARSRSRWRLMTFALVALVFMSILIGSVGLSDEDHIARFKVNGTIFSDEERTKLLKQIAENESVKALIVSINSPGGTTAGSEALFHSLRDVAEKKPVVAVIDELAASGGYIAALGADHIINRETSIVGSIGVIFQWAEAEQLLNTIGVKMNAVKSDPRKAEPDMFKPLPPEGRKVIEDLVAQSHQWFLNLVAERRGLSVENARRLGDGRIYSGQTAVAENLSDAIGDQNDAQDWLNTNHGIEDDLEIIQYKVDPNENLWGALAKSMRSEGPVKGLFTGIMTVIFSGGAVGHQDLTGLLAIWRP